MSRKNGRTIEVLPGNARRPSVPKKPSEAVYVRLPEEQPAELFEFQDEGGEGAAAYVDEALQGVMLELGERDDKAKVTVKRLVQAQGVRKEEWLFECHPKEFSVAQLQQDFGGGDYRITVYGVQQGSNYKVIHADKRLTIGEPRGAVKPGLAGAATVPGVGSPQDLTRAISEAIVGPFTALAQTLAQMIGKQPSRAEMLAELKQMREIFGPGDTAPVADPFTALERAVKLMQDARGSAPTPNEDGEIPPTQIISQGIGLLKEFFDAHRNRPMQAAPDVPALAAPTPGTQSNPIPQPIPNPEENESMKLAQLALRAQLGMLLHAAKSDMDSATYAGLIYDQAPDEVIATLQSETWFDDLCKLNPGFTEVKPWCEKVRGEVLQMLADDNPPESNASSAPQGDGSASAPPAGPDSLTH
jgi:hypothetical protein